MSAVVIMSPVFEYLDRHDTWAQVFTTHSVASFGPILVGAIALLWSLRIHSEATEDIRIAEETGAYQFPKE